MTQNLTLKNTLPNLVRSETLRYLPMFINDIQEEESTFFGERINLSFA